MVVTGIERLKQIETLQRRHLESADAQRVAVVTEDAVVAAAAVAVDHLVSAENATVAELGVTVFGPESEADVDFLEHLEERPVEIEAAATSGAASMQQSCWGG